MSEKLSFLYLLSGNGWIWDHDGAEDDDSGERFNMTVLGSGYHYVISAIVSEYPKHLSLDGYYGVRWLEMIDHPDSSCIGLTINDLHDIEVALISAENNLVQIGVPFVLDYKFHDSNFKFGCNFTAEEKKQMNIECRKRYGLTVDEHKYDGDDEEE